MHTNVGKRAHIHTYIEIHTCTCTNTHRCRRPTARQNCDFKSIHMYVHTYACMHAHIHRQINTHTYSGNHTHIHTYTCTHTRTHAHTLLQAPNCSLRQWFHTHVRTHIHMHARTHRQRNTHTYSGNYTHIHGQVKTRTNIHMYTHTRTLTATCAQLPIATVILNLCTFTDTQHINGHTYTCMHYTLTHAQTHTLLQAPNYSLQQLILNFVNRRNKQAGRGGGAAAGGGGRSPQQQVRCARKLCVCVCMYLWTAGRQRMGSSGRWQNTTRVGQSRINTLHRTLYMTKSLQKSLYIHSLCMACWPTLNVTARTDNRAPLLVCDF